MSLRTIRSRVEKASQKLKRLMQEQKCRECVLVVYDQDQQASIYYEGDGAAPKPQRG